MEPKNHPDGRPDIVAATRGGDALVPMDNEDDPATATHEQALYWQGIYKEIVAMEEEVVERVKVLMERLSPEARREVELTNLPVVTSQADRYRARLGFWEARLDDLKAKL